MITTVVATTCPPIFKKEVVYRIGIPLSLGGILVQLFWNLLSEDVKGGGCIQREGHRVMTFWMFEYSLCDGLVVKSLAHRGHAARILRLSIKAKK